MLSQKARYALRALVELARAGDQQLTAGEIAVRAAPPRKIRVIDGPLALAPCVSQMAFRKCDDCPDLETCALRPALRRARDATAQVLEAYSLADAVADSDGARTAAVVSLA